MITYYGRIFVSVLFAVICFTFYTFPADNKSKKSIHNTSGTPHYYKLNINNISTYIFENGEADISGKYYPVNPGFEYPRGTNKHSVYKSGFLWGAKINNEVHVGGSTYISGLLPGVILSDGTAEDTASADKRIWRVRPDWRISSFTNEINDGEGIAAEIKAKYENDWNEWPAAKGAPYEDINDNNVYEPDIDIAGFPGASQTIWFAANDLDSATAYSLYGSPPMGIEIQVTAWAYSHSTPLSNMIFKKYTIINKSSSIFEDMYISVWSDADIGDATDDFTGVDTLLSLGYQYNGNVSDYVYGTTPPAAGYDIFHGAVVPGAPSDTAFVGLKKIPGKKNLPATAFYYFIGGSLEYGDPALGHYEQGSLEFYNLFQGKYGPTGEFFEVPEHLGGGVTKFPLSGDPVTQTGYLDGFYFEPDDRRFGVASGPFNMSPRDTQEITIVQIAAGAAPGVNNIEAVTLLKEYDKMIDTYFKDLTLPPALPQPQTIVSNLDNEIVLTWSDPAVVKETESFDYKGYRFQGYNVYQLPDSSADISEGIRIATYDIEDTVGAIKNFITNPAAGELEERFVQFGLNSGVRRYIIISKDTLNNNPLFNGRRYYFAVTAYTYNPEPFGGQRSFESSPAVVTAIPQINIPGQNYEHPVGDTLISYRISGSGMGNVVPVVIDPLKTIGHTYNITFNEDDTWNLIDSTTNEVKATRQRNQTGDEDYIVVDGIMIKVIGLSEGIADNGMGIVEIAYGYQRIPPEGYDTWGAPFEGNTVWGSINWQGFTGEERQRYFVFNGLSNLLSSVEKYAGYIDGRDFELRFTETGGYGVYGFTSNMISRVPFELWDIGIATPNDPSDDKRMIPFLMAYNNEDNEDSVWGKLNRDYLGIYSITDWIYWMDPDPTVNNAYERFAQTAEAAGGAGNIYPRLTDGSLQGYWAELYGSLIYPLGSIAIKDADRDSVAAPPPGSVIRFNTNKINNIDDVYGFKAPEIISDINDAKQDVEMIKAFPNPYYANNPNEHYTGERFITFSHLPTRADIKVFNLAGQLVRKMQKDDPGQFFNWDLMNDNGVIVASGIFIVQIDMPELGKNKILKVAVIQKQ